MRGYTAKKGNRYYAVIYEGVDSTTGKERRRWYPAGPRKADAEKLVTELVKRHNDGEYRTPDRVTVHDYLVKRWLPSQRSQLKETTFHSYETNLQLHVLPTLGGIALAKLAPEDLDALYAQLLESGRRNKTTGGPGLSPSSVRYIHRILRKALGDAVRKGTLVRNPASLADPPKRSTIGTRDREMKVWTAAQLQVFLDSLDGQRLAPAFVLSAHTGMRRGEVAGLRWSDLDLPAKLIHVRQAAVVVNYALRLTDVKTAHGNRTIDVNDDVVRALTAWRRKQAEERLLLGADYDDHDLVFARPDGTATHPEVLSRTFDRIITRTKLPRIRLHDVRHTHASLLLKAGVPVKVVSERLGHATASFTLDVYSWVLPGMQADAAAIFSRLMSAGPVEDPVEVEAPRQAQDRSLRR